MNVHVLLETKVLNNTTLEKYHSLPKNPIFPPQNHNTSNNNTRNPTCNTPSLTRRTPCWRHWRTAWDSAFAASRWAPFEIELNARSLLHIIIHTAHLALCTRASHLHVRTAEALSTHCERDKRTHPTLAADRRDRGAFYFISSAGM